MNAQERPRSRIRRGREVVAGATEEVLDVRRKRRVPIAWRLLAALATLIAVGTGLLLLPWMTTQPITLVDALFTSTSASAVTGLSVVTTGTTFTRLGQWVLLGLMQLGGLGFVVVTVLTLRLLGRQVSLMDRLAVSSSLGLASSRAILQVLGRTLVGMLAVEGVGALILAIHWRWSGLVPAGDAVFYGLFHAVAAYCNAGFDLFSGQAQYPQGLPDDPITLLTLGCLVILGGLGIPVFMEMLHRWEVRRVDRRRRHLSLQTWLTLWSALLLIGVGWIGLLIGEYRYSVASPEHSLGDRLLQAWFQSVAARTAGFTTLSDLGDLHGASRLLLICLMFIGSAPASMGGGITTGAFSVLVVAMWSFVRGYNTVHARGRTIPVSTIWRAVAVLLISLGVVTGATWLLLFTQEASFSSALFEVVSAFSTTGLTLGLTGEVNTVGRLVLIALMFWGRLGAITIMLVLLQRGPREHLIRYPEETVLVG